MTTTKGRLALPLAMLCMAFKCEAPVVSLDTADTGSSPSLWGGELPACADELSSDGTVAVGSTAPDFTLESQSGPVRLWEFCDKVVLLCSEPQWARGWEDTVDDLQDNLGVYGAAGLVPLLLVPEVVGGGVPDAPMLQSLAEAGGATFPLLADPAWMVSQEWEQDGNVRTCALLGAGARVLGFDFNVKPEDIEEALEDLE